MVWGGSAAGREEEAKEANALRGDSATVRTLLARGASLSRADAHRVDEIIHRRGFAFAHGAAHGQVMDARLDSAARLLNQNGRHTEGNSVLTTGFTEPLTAAQKARRESLQDRSEAAAEASRAANTLATSRERANSDDAQSVEETFAHAEARASVIMNVQPNKLRVGGREFRVKRNPVGSGAFVYDPRTRFYGVERYLIWWMPEEGKVYPLNSPSKMVTPELPWPREDGIDAPSTAAVVDYVFRGKPMSLPERRDSRPQTTSTFTVKEYRVYRTLMNVPMSVGEEQALQNSAERYGITAEEARKAVDKVQKVLFRNQWFGSPDSEIQYASDWQGERP